MKKAGPRAWALAAALLTAGCVVHRGGFAEPAPPAPEGAVSLVVVGNAGAPTRHASAVAQELDRVLVAEHEAGREPVVLMLGSHTLAARPDRRRGRCVDARSVWAREGASDIAAAVRRHTGRGHASYGVVGPRDHACDVARTYRDPDAGAPFTMPSPHYVVRIDARGHSEVASRCTGDTCTVDPLPDEAPRLELVVVDAAIYQQPPSALGRDRSLAQLGSLLSALPSGPTAPPRVLVSSLPVEAAGYHGMGGGRPDASFHYLPPALQDAVRSGRFAGAVGAHDRAVYAAADITDAVKRSDRVWLQRPMFQVVSGSASVPDARAAAGYRRLRYFRANTYEPPIYSDRAGFAVVRVTRSEAQAEVVARGARGWQRTALTAPLRPNPHPSRTTSPGMAPCLRCPAVPASERN